MQTKTAGWDIGGAHVKVALLDEAGQVIRVEQQACPLWKGIEHLHSAIAELGRRIDLQDCHHAVTMTGELVDCFTSREQGVHAIIQAVCQHFAPENVSIFAGLQGFLSAGDVQASDCMHIASANWLASVMLVAEQMPSALFVDIGSTTTDILLIENRQLKIEGFTDYQRLVSGELVYTGIIRTSVMAIAQEAEFNGRSMGLMAEHFATMADVYRVCGDLNEAHDQAETADGAEKTASASALRLSRLTGYEFSESDWPLWLEFARHLKARQQRKIELACQVQLRRAAQPAAHAWVGAGVGRFLLREIAGQHGANYIDFASLLTSGADTGQGLDTGDCAPAVAVACLANSNRV